jgi:hypothetical protein
MGKNDLSSLKIKTDKKLPPANTASLLEPKNKVGRPAKSAGECENEPLTLKLTQSEIAILKKKAGLVPLCRYLKHYLRTETSFLSE